MSSTGSFLDPQSRQTGVSFFFSVSFSLFLLVLCCKWLNKVVVWVFCGEKATLWRSLSSTRCPAVLWRFTTMDSTKKELTLWTVLEAFLSAPFLLEANSLIPSRLILQGPPGTTPTSPSRSVLASKKKKKRLRKDGKRKKVWRWHLGTTDRLRS